MAGWAPGGEPAAGVRTARGLGAWGWQPHCDAAMQAYDGASMQWWGELPSLGCRPGTQGCRPWQHGGALAGRWRMRRPTPETWVVSRHAQQPRSRQTHPFCGSRTGLLVCSGGPALLLKHPAHSPPNPR